MLGIVSSLAIGRFIRDVAERMQMTVNKVDDVRFVLFSGHDNTIAPFLASFNVFDARQPPMASGMRFHPSLWTTNQTFTSMFVMQISDFARVVRRRPGQALVALRV